MKNGNLIRGWERDKSGSALVEAAILFPVLLVMIFGVYDIGHAITVNHKMITASQVIADLITRNRSVDDQIINEAIEAARLSMQPYATSTDDFGVDIVSVQFDEDDEPVVLWRETQGMSEDINAVERTTGLGTAGEGAVAVTMIYDYEPTFGNMIIADFRMRETAFARGRRSPTVTRE